MDVVDFDGLFRPSRFPPNRHEVAVLRDASAEVISGAPNIDYEHSGSGRHAEVCFWPDRSLRRRARDGRVVTLEKVFGSPSVLNKASTAMIVSCLTRLSGYELNGKTTGGAAHPIRLSALLTRGRIPRTVIDQYHAAGN